LTGSLRPEMILGLGMETVGTKMSSNPYFAHSHDMLHLYTIKTGLILAAYFSYREQATSYLRDKLFRRPT
jgi:hypothetical protein